MAEFGSLCVKSISTVAFFNSSSDKQAKSINKRLTPQNRLYLMFLDSTLPLFNRFDKMFQVNGNAC